MKKFKFKFKNNNKNRKCIMGFKFFQFQPDNTTDKNRGIK